LLRTTSQRSKPFWQLKLPIYWRVIMDNDEVQTALRSVDAGDGPRVEFTQKPDSRVIDLIKRLEQRANDCEARDGTTFPEAAKGQIDNCAARAAGIRDAVHSIKITFGL
jgi:hypothetical protein